jgi:crotonobetainyl-CoA:carnitine CoA-transferase CaiB-like acyl-CoA transferase
MMFYGERKEIIMPLSRINVVDLTRIIAGPFCTLLLADMGAEVIKVEPPEGDPLRAQGVIKDGLSWYYTSYNRNKKSIILDLYIDDGKEILKSLMRKSDIVVDNFRPGVMSKMGFSYSRLKELRQDIIYCGITGFGAGGPYKDRPAFDFIAQAISGFMSLNGCEGEEPMRVGVPISDLIAGLYAALGIVSSLLHRSQTGEGQEIQTSLVDGLYSFMSYMAANFLASGELPKRTGNDHPIVSPYGIFRASDGDIAIAPSNDQFYFKLINVLGLNHLKDDPEFTSNDLRVAKRAKINAIIQEKIAMQSQEYWIEVLNKAGVPCSTVRNLRKAFNDPQVHHQEMIIEAEHPGHGKVKMVGFPIKLSQSPCRIRRPAPKLGEHTEEVLTGLGYTLEQIKSLRERKVI